jgi:hypothetical protein
MTSLPLPPSTSSSSSSWNAGCRSRKESTSSHVVEAVVSPLWISTRRTPCAKWVRTARSGLGIAAPLWMDGRGGGVASGTSMNFLRRPTWKTSCSRVRGDRARCTATALMSSVTWYGLKKRGFSFPLVAWGREAAAR